MNYKIFLDTSSQQFLTSFTALPERRPKVQDIIRLKNNTRLYKITKQIPSNPSENPPETINYFVRLLDSSPDSVTMDGSRQSFQNSIRSL